jgi:hypothetical protein
MKLMHNAVDDGFPSSDCIVSVLRTKSPFIAFVAILAKVSMGYSMSLIYGGGKRV